MTPIVDTEIHLSQAFPGETIKLNDYSEMLERLSNPSVTITLIPGRCGSTYFASIIRGTRVCGTGEEVFNQLTASDWRSAGPDLATVFASRLKICISGDVCWVEVAPDRFANLVSIVDTRILRKWNYTTLLRRDILAQAISYIYAEHSGVWHSTQGKLESNISLGTDDAVAAVVQRVKMIEQDETKIRDMLRKYASRGQLAQYYEGLVASPRETALEFLRFNGVPYDICQLDFGGGEEVRRLRKSGDIELYDACLKRVPWLARMIADRNRMAMTW